MITGSTGADHSGSLVGVDGKIETQFVDAGELRFAVDVCGDPASEHLALLLHGLPECAFSWRHQLPLLASLGYKAWAPNQRGYGRTTRPAEVSSYRLEVLVDDVGNLIDESGCKSVTLIGHDWGGMVAWASAFAGVRPLARLVVMNMPHPRRMAEGLRTWKQMRRSLYALFFQIPWLPESLLRALLKDPPYLETPTLMIWGEVDVALGKELTYGTEELIRDLTLRYLPGVSHWVQQEAPESVNAMLEAWLQGKPVPEHG